MNGLCRRCRVCTDHILSVNRLNRECLCFRECECALLTVIVVAPHECALCRILYILNITAALSFHTNPCFFFTIGSRKKNFLHKEETKNSKIKFKKILNSQKGSNQSPSLSNLDIRVLTEYVQKKVQLWGKSQ